MAPLGNVADIQSVNRNECERYVWKKEFISKGSHTNIVLS